MSRSTIQDNNAKNSKSSSVASSIVDCKVAEVKLIRSFESIGSIRDEKFDWLHWMCMISEETFVITDHSKLHLFQTSPIKEIKSTILKENADLKGIVKLQSGLICVVDNENRCAYLLDKDNDFRIVKETGLGKKKRWLYACAEDPKNGDIFIADRDNKSLLILNSHTFSLKDEIIIDLPRQFKNRISLRDVKIHNNCVYVTDNGYGNRCIHVFSLQIEYIRSFGFDKLENPNEILFSKSGQILVIDRLFEKKHLIHIFDKNEKHEAAHLLDNCIESTNGLFLNEESMLLTSYEFDYYDVDLLQEYVNQNGWPFNTHGCTTGIESLVGKKEKRSTLKTTNIQIYKLIF